MLRFFILAVLVATACASSKCFLKALNAATIEVREDLHLSLQKKLLPFVKTEGCVSSTFKYPTPSGKLASVFAAKVIRFGYIHDEIFFDEFRDFANRIVAAINAHYKKNIVASFTPFTNPNAIMQALHNGEIDASTPTLSSVPYLTEQIRGENFLSTCALEALSISFYTHKAANIDSLDELAKRIKTDETGKNKIACSSESEQYFLMSLFNNYPIEVVKDTSKAVVPGDGYIALFTNSLTSPAEDLSMIDGRLLVPVRMFIGGKTSTKKVSVFTIKRSFHRGNLLLRSCFDRAIASVQAENADAFGTMFNNTDMLSFFDCAPSSLSSPAKIREGSLKEIIDRNKIILGYSPLYAPPFVNTSNFDPESLLVKFENKFVKEVSQILKLDRPLDVERQIFKDSDAVFEALESGKIDATSMSFHLGGFAKKRHRVEEYSSACVPMSWRVRLWYDLSVNTGISSFDDIARLLAYSKILVLGNKGLVAVAQDLFGDGVQTKIVESVEEAFDLLHRDNNYAAYLGDYLCQTPNEKDVHSVTTDLSLPITMFFRYDNDSTYFLLIFIILLILLIAFPFALLLILCRKKRGFCVGTGTATKMKKLKEETDDYDTFKDNELESRQDIKIEF